MNQPVQNNQPSRTLSEHQLATYADAGFVALPQFLSGDAFSTLIGELNEFIATGVSQMPVDHVFYEQKGEGSTLKQLQHLERYHETFAQLLSTGPFRQLAEELLGETAVPQNLQYFNKPPKVGLPTPPHQDGYYFKIAPCNALTMWLALEAVDAETGCVRYVSGSHKLGLRPHARTQTLGFSQGIADFPTPADRQAEQAMPAQAGDLLVHDALTIHWADGNQSATRTRRALGFIYYGQSAKIDAAAAAAYQQQLTADLLAAGKL